jgi:AcrR family transcriptional regulator
MSTGSVERMPKISDEHRENRRAEITQAALRCFTRSGYQQTSMADIISESGLSAGAIYSYFPSKKELIREVAQTVLANRRGELVAAQEDHVLSPAEIVTVLVRGIGKEAPIAAIVQTWAEATVDPGVRDTLLATLGTVRAVIVDGLTRWAQTHPHVADAYDGSPERWAQASAPVVMSVIPGFALQSALMPGFEVEEFLAALPGVLTGGIAPTPRA